VSEEVERHLFFSNNKTVKLSNKGI